MRIVVIGGSGLIGSKVVSKLRKLGHEVIAASPSTGVNTITGEGLAEALAGAQVVVDVANSPSFEDKAVMSFFETAGRNIHAAETAAGVKHHVALSVVGTERLLASGYFRAKMAQENLIKASGIPYTIVRATQFFEFVGTIAQSSIVGETARATPALFQPMASEDVSAAVVDATLAEPVDGIIEIAGPEKVSLASMIRKHFQGTHEYREVIEDADALYFGVKLDDQSLTPANGARLGTIRFDEWFAQSAGAKK
jgi:uncharacterized protein YbjT (DUF2867 family)